MNEPEDGGLSALVMSCAYAVIAGQRTVTISATGKRPAGFPRGELLSVNQAGVSNYAVNPVKALAWIHARSIKEPHPTIEPTSANPAGFEPASANPAVEIEPASAKETP